MNARRRALKAANHAGRVRDMKCTKVRYRDEIGAKLAMAKVQATGNPNRPKSESRAYRCRRCNGWHLTSQAANQQVSGGRDVV